MKHTKKMILILFFTTLMVAACRAGGTGPTAWIDQPLDKETFPLQPLTLQSHASDSDGVDDIEFFVDDQSLLVVGAGGSRLGQAAMEWSPTSPGVYTISVRATDLAGNEGDAAYATITISDTVAVVNPPDEVPITIESESEEEEEEEIQVAEEPVEPKGPFAASNQTINCRSGADTAFDATASLKAGQQALIVGRLANNSWLLIEHPERSLECWVAATIVKVTGDLDDVPVRQSPPLPQKPPAAEEPAEAPPAEQPAETDTTPPIISSVWASPATIFQNGCSGEAQTTVLYVEALDISGIKNVEAAWSIGSESGSAALTFAGNSRYQATLGPFSTAGTLTIYGSVVDNAGNWTPFTINVTIKCCIC
jgi:hypothetical protein